MEKIIICPFDLFDFKQTVFIASEDASDIEAVAETTIDDLGKTIAGVSAANDINFIRLIGQEDYADNIANDIKKYNMKFYGNRQIRIEVN
jgi:hypothetical protein